MAAKKKPKPPTGLRTCEDCGGAFPGTEMYTGPCPYLEEVRGEYRLVTLCNHCLRESCRDI
jgi:ribosomal protein S14